MSTNTTVIKQENPDKDITQFVPFGAADAIKLSAVIVQRYLCNPTRKGAICTERDAIKFVMLCKAQRLNPFAGDAFIIGYDGNDGPQFSLVTAHQAFLKRAESCPDFEGMESGIILIKDSETGELEERSGDFYLRDEEEKVVGGWAKVYRKGRKPTYRRIRMDRFYKDVAQWKVDAAGMIVKCAEADALRSTFPSLLGGLYMDGEHSMVIDIGGDKSSVTSSRVVEIKALPDAAPTQQAQPVEAAKPTVTEAQEITPQSELAEFVVKSGFSFDQFKSWADGAGTIPGVLSLGSFDEIKTDDAKRMLRAKAGLLTGLKAGGK